YCTSCNVRSQYYRAIYILCCFFLFFWYIWNFASSFRIANPNGQEYAHFLGCVFTNVVTGRAIYSKMIRYFVLTSKLAIHNINMIVAMMKIYVGHHVDNIIPDIIVAYDDYCGLQAQILTLQKTTTNNTIKGLEVHFYKHNKQFTDKHTLVNVIFVILVVTI
ncbi:hypothetical protein ACJX0J_015475, partial [Zea mays]